jgi:beta-glucosidase/6-phospho-beta-glucosidase/beta-galactosidase
MNHVQSAGGATAPFPHIGAFESTKLAGSGIDILGTTRHIERWRSDLQMLYSASLMDLRYSVPWHRIESVPGVFDFSWFDLPMEYMRTNGMRPILDPLHHISFPDWLENGFANPDFPALYARFVTAVAKRYPWVQSYTVFNEPLPTTLFCSYTGGWYPHQASDECFVRMAVNVGRAICLVSEALRRLRSDIRFVHVDTCEQHRALDNASEDWVRFASARRFLMHDLVLGLIDKAHTLYPYLRNHGFTDYDMQWFSEHKARIDVLGLDYYIHSEIEWYWDTKLQRSNISWPVQNPVGFAQVAREYAGRYQLPVMLSETNLRGSCLDRLTWLKFMEEQCEHLAMEVDFRGFCWYPSIDSTDWCNFCQKATGTVDPQGIWMLDQFRWDRHASELSENYVELASGRRRADGLPAYLFTPETGKELVGYEKLMGHWTDWREQGLPRAA